MAEQKRTQQFWSDLDPTNKFSTFKDAEEHDRRLSQSKTAKESINKFNRVAPQMDAAKMGGTDYMTAPKDQIQSQAEGEVLNEMYGGKRTALAKSYGLGVNESPEAKQFMASEQASDDVAQQDQSKQAARNLAAQLKAGGKQYGVLSSVLEAVADGADVESINKMLGTNLGSVGLENVEQVGRAELQGSKQDHEIELEKLKSSLREKEQATAQPERAKADATTLRKEYNQIGRDFTEVYGAQKRIEAVGKNPSAAGDLALIFGYMKMLDPRSTVREGEFANAENSGGISSRVVSQYNKIINGERLSADIRADFLAQSERMYETYRDTQERNNKRYAALAQQYGVEPTHVIDEMPDAKEYDKKRREKLKTSLLGGGDGQ